MAHSLDSDVDPPKKDLNQPEASETQVFGWSRAARLAAVAGVALVVGGALGLRLWGISNGLPFAYNSDEQQHFVPPAIDFFTKGYNPKDLTNPPAYTYVVHGVYRLLYRSGSEAAEKLKHHRTQVFLIARTTAAVLATLSVGGLYLAGRRLFDHRTGLVGAAILGAAFLPVYQAHWALNDAPTILPVTVSLVGVAGILGRGRGSEYVLAGAAAGLAAAFKYPAGIALVPVLTATAVRAWEDRAPRRGAVWGLLALISAAVAFVIANPFSVLDPSSFLAALRYVFPTYTLGTTLKPGIAVDNGILYYLWTLTWGLGWIPLSLALAGALLLFVRRSKLGLVLVPVVFLYLLYMGTQGRYLARWFLPMYPILALLASYAIIQVASLARGRWGSLSVVVVLMLAATAQGLVHDLHLGRVLTQPDTREVARDWLASNVPPGSAILVEPDRVYLPPVSPRQVAAQHDWRLITTAKSFVQEGLVPPASQGVTEEYPATLRPELIDLYLAKDICWVVIGGRAKGVAQRSGLDEALAYYGALEQRAEVRFRISPYRSGSSPPPWNLDWSFTYYPLEFDRPGPEITVYRLTGNPCGGT